MVLPRLTGRVSPLVVVSLSVTLIFTLSSCSSSVSTSNARAQETDDGPETDPSFIVPDGTPKEILAFVKKMLEDKNQKRFANQQEYVRDAVKTQRAIISAGDKLLAQKIDDKMAEEAVQMKLRALTMLAANNVGNSAKDALAAVTKLKSDPREIVAKTAERYWLPIQSVNAVSMTVEERKSLIEEIATAVEKTKFSPESVEAAKLLATVLTDSSHVDEAALLYEQIAKVSAESKDPKFRPNAEVFAAMARKIRLPGNFMEVEGKLLDGTDFNWASYRGKVVLVDFWATWCGPCVQDLVHVKEVYKKYHDKGFDVVGISMDHARLALDKFIEKEQLPWAQLYDEDRQRGKGWNSPMAKKYGINAIPATMLVDKDGKVVMMDARGDELDQQLIKLLGPAE